MIKNDITIRVAGRAGDGSLTTADILSKVFKDLGLWLVTYKDFPSNIRGLPTNITLRANEKRIYYGRKDELDYLLAFDKKNVEIHLEDVTKNGVVIFDNSNEELSEDLIRNDIHYYFVPMQSIAKNKLGLEVIKNIIAVGVITYLLKMDYQKTKEIIYNHFLKSKGEKIASKNIEAFDAGYNYAKENIEKFDDYIIEEVENEQRTYFIMGNEALAFGAIVGGCRFYASYPITPASEVLEILSKELPKYGGVVVQAEDEIASINFAIGAAYAGVRAMTGTSGPGVSLKTETIGLAVMNETPVVIYLSQRAGPSTGLPTKVEQADVYHAIFGGHGDAPRIVIAPGNVKEMFEFAILAFNLAEKYQTPVILLADQVLAQNKYTIPVEEIDLSKVKIERGKILSQKELDELISRGEKYLRYKITDDGISPRTIPGMEGGIFNANSNEHEEDGYTTEDPKRRRAMLEKRLRKIFETARKNGDLPEDLIFGEGKIGIIGFGFTYGPIMEAMERLEKKGIKVKFLQIRTLWPLDKEKIASFIDTCDKVVVVEQNAQGQFANVIKMFYKNHEKIENLLRYDGRGFTPRDITNKIESYAKDQKTYNYKEIEERIYNFWIENELFKANPKNVLEGKKKSFSIMMPPPNITGRIHMGHLLNNTMQDILSRYYRMKGYEVLWQPGTDHAGIATQNVVERELLKEGKTRYEIGKDEFVKRIWKWKEEYGNIIINQLKKLGISADWSRLKFTMDEDYYNAVIYAFNELYKVGLIYKGLYIINWCPRCYTTLANDEVESLEVEGKLYYLKYPILNESEYIIVATTRPETYLGDIAIAVNPKDERYKHLIGKKVRLPLIDWSRRDYYGSEVSSIIEIIADEFVDINFGTGAVKITPAHDKDDFEIGKKYKLPMVLIMDYYGILNDNAGIFKGLDRFKGREEIVKKLSENGFIERIENYKYNVGICYRCDTIVEPIISEQWFLNLRYFKDIAKKVVEEGKIEIIPEHGKKIYFNWWDNIRDWAISRQIWWGHKIPIEGEDDVLDTWFSSALWPIATLGWPNKTDELKAFFPTSILITGWDILFFWVARMIVMSLFFENEVPFKRVYLHGLVRDEKGRKMSKSLGNSPEPLELFEKYSVDGVRMGLMLITPEGQDVKFSEKYMEVGRNYANKIWNIGRFLKLNFDGNYNPLKNLEIEDKWILYQLDELIIKINEGLENCEFNNCAKLLYDFTWHKFADWYIEAIKTREDKNCAISNALFVFENLLKLHHPYMPFITEELYQNLFNKKISIMLEEFPNKYGFNFKEDFEHFEFIKSLIEEIREIKGIFRIQNRKDLKLFINISESEKKFVELVKNNFRIISFLSGIESFNETIEKIKNSAIIAMRGFLGFILLGDIDFEKERFRIYKELEMIKNLYSSIKRRLEDEEFLKKAPTDVIENQRNKLSELGSKIEKLNRILEQ